MKNNIQTKLNLCGDKCIVSGNEGRLHQAVLNVINNAVQAIEESGVISIETNKKGDMLELIISDTGSGIDEKILPTLSSNCNSIIIKGELDKIELIQKICTSLLDRFRNEDNVYVFYLDYMDVLLNPPYPFITNLILKDMNIETDSLLISEHVQQIKEVIKDKILYIIANNIFSRVVKPPSNANYEIADWFQKEISCFKQLISNRNKRT